MKIKIILLLLAFTFNQQLFAQLRLPAFFTDGMVLQQKKVNRVWGWAKSQQLVHVDFMGKLYPAYANSNGEWQVLLDASPAGNAGAIIVSAEGEKIKLNNILIGEVWICGGQSNMEWAMKQCPEIYKEELAIANNDEIRFVVVDHATANTPQQDVSVLKKWTPITPATIGDCSAVAYWYAKKLNKDLKVPIGLVVSSWGGTFAESWTSFEGLHDFPNYTQTFIEKIKPLNLDNTGPQMQLARNKYQQKIDEKIAFVNDVVKPGFDDSQWEEMYLPKQWEVQGYPALDGVVMYRVAFNVSAEDAGKEAVLNLPAVDDMDSTYVNGIFIGSINQWDALRKYAIPAGVLKAGKNILVIRVQDNGGGGGLAPAEEKFNVVIQKKIIPLSGMAKFIIIAELEDITGGNGDIFHQPVVLYNGMIAPLQLLSIRGAIWYQGENNAVKAKEYQTLFPAMINDWRNKWGQGDFPFLFVQLSSFGAIVQQPMQSNWAELREAQSKALVLPNTAMAVTLDIGEPGDIHPQKKKEVGDRLAAAALKLVYGKSTLVSSSPALKGYKIDGNKIVLQLKDIGNGLMIKGKHLKQFCIAGADKKFVWADAIIKGNEIIVYSKLIQNPVAVRYAWADSPVDANLYNKEGFPAGSFRTDNW